MKLSFKQFLKPDWRKIILTLVLIVVSLFFNWRFVFGYSDMSILKSTNVLDFHYVIRGCPAPYLYLGVSGGNINSFSIHYSLFLADLIFWYLFSCFMIWIYDKFAKKFY